MAQLEGERAAIFSDPAYKRSGGNGNYVLSTSNVGYTPLFGGFAAVRFALAFVLKAKAGSYI